MKRYQNALLAGVAAIAIATSAGLASAQTHGGGSMGGGMSSGGSGASDQSPATQAAPSTSGESGGASQHPGTGMQHGGTGPGTGMRPQAQTQPGAAGAAGKGEPQRHAQGAGSGKPSTAESGSHTGKREAQTPDHGPKGQKSGTAMEGHGAPPAAGPREGANVRPGSEGPSGAREGANVAPGGSVKFSERQRTTIKRTIIDGHSAPRVGHVDFDVRVGTVVPRGSIHIVPVPETLVRIEPSWRGLLYFVYEDEIVVVNPSDMHIVAVVAV